MQKCLIGKLSEEISHNDEETDWKLCGHDGCATVECIAVIRATARARARLENSFFNFLSACRSCIWTVFLIATSFHHLHAITLGIGSGVTVFCFCGASNCLPLAVFFWVTFTCLTFQGVAYDWKGINNS